MHKIDGKNATEDGRFQEYDPATGQGATYITAGWLNAVQGELIAILESQGIEPSKASSAQVLAALDGRFVSRSGLAAAGGAALVGYQGGTVSDALANLAQSLLSGLSGGAPLYADTAAGLAATSEGDYFNVPSQEPNETLILYRHDAGPVATEIGRSSSAEVVARLAESLQENDGTKTIHAFTDSNGATLLHIKPNGDLMPFGSERSVQDGIAHAPEQKGENEYLHEWADSAGTTVMALSQSGELSFGNKTLQGDYSGSEVVTGLEYRAQGNEDIARLYFDIAKFGGRIPFRSQARLSGFNDDPVVLKSRFAQAVPLTDTSGLAFFCQQNVNLSNGSENAQRVCVKPYTLESDGSITLGSQVVIDEPADWSSGLGYSCEPAGLLLPSGRVLLMLRRNDNADGTLTGGDPPIFNIYTTYSDDDGATWSTPVLTVAHGGLDKASGSAAPIITPSGRIVYPLYSSAKKIFSIYSDDDGATWTLSNVLTTTDAYNEPAIFVRDDGTLMMLARQGHDLMNLFRGVFTSSDDGETWVFEGDNDTAAFTASNTALIKTEWNQCGFPKVIAASSADDRGGTASRTMYRVRISYDDGDTFVAESTLFPDEQLTGYSQLARLYDDMFMLSYETASPVSALAPEGNINTRNNTFIMAFNLAELLKNVSHS